MSGMYARVESGQVVSIGPVPTSYANISGFHLLSDEELKVYGFYPFEDNYPTYDPMTEKVVNNGYDIQEDKVVVDYSVLPLSQEELDFIKEGVVAACLQKAVVILRDNDWTQLADAGLDPGDKADYDDLRDHLRALLSTFDAHTASDLVAIRDKMDAAIPDNAFRASAFTTKMTDLNDALTSLLEEEL